MLKITSKKLILLAVDGIGACVAVYAALFLRYGEAPVQQSLSQHFLIFCPVIALFFFLYYSFDFYDLSPFYSKLKQISRIVNIHLSLGVFGFGYFYLAADYTAFTPKTILVLFVLSSFVISIVWRIFIAPQMFSSDNKSKALLIAEGEEYDELREVVNSHSYFSFSFVDHLVVKDADLSKEDETLTLLRKLLEENAITQVVVDIRDVRTASLLPYLYNLASQRKIHVFDAALVYQDILKKMPMRGIGHFWFFESVHLNIQAYEAVKRVLDIIVALPLLCVYVIFVPFIYLAIKLDDGGPLFSIQRRYGRGGKILNIYKIRTMQFTDDGDWVLQNKTNKVTKVGAFLRKTRLDEFPQLFNVLKGDVSLVGPRPDVLANGGKLSAQIPFYMMRYTVTPGLSGWAQVNQDVPPNSLEETKVRLQYDLFYVKNRSLLLDFIIMIKTFRVLVLRTGI